MSKIIFQGFNDVKHPFTPNNAERRILNSQKISFEANSEKKLIIFSIKQCEVPAEYQAKTIQMVMDNYTRTVGYGTFMSRCYGDRIDIVEEFTKVIKNNSVLEF